MAYIDRLAIINNMTKGKKIYYKGVKVNSIGLPIFNNSNKENRRARKRNLYHTTFQSSFKKSALKDLVVMYDIPHDFKKERDWFRRHLIKFGYIMIQKSVWVGPSPLPKEFVKYLKEIKIEDKLKTFKLAKPYDSSISAMA